MFKEFEDKHEQMARQLVHWTQAATRLSKLEELASPASWKGLEHYLNTSLRESLQKGLDKLQDRGSILYGKFQQAATVHQLKELQSDLDAFRKKYLRTETMMDFYTDAINTRTNNDMAAVLRACDFIAQKSMSMILEPLGKIAPPVLVYIDKGLGASILKAGLRLWDGETTSPVAAIKVVRHNLYRPTALIHEAGHQVAHILNWNKELGEVLHERLKDTSPDLAEAWSGWASEIAADTFAFVHTGYASIVGLHDVVAGDNKFVFRYHALDPHPISYLRVLLGIAMCRLTYGEGPWDKMKGVWKETYQVDRARPEVRKLIKQSVPMLMEIAKCCLQTRMKAFGNKAIVYWINPHSVSPEQLSKFVRMAGDAIHSSNYWVSTEAIRLLALGGYQIATSPGMVPQLLQQQRNWMLKLGGTLQAA